MIYTVKRIDEDLDFGCEERAEGAPLMSVVTLTDENGKELRIRHIDRLLYERGIDQGSRVQFDEKNHLVKTPESKPKVAFVCVHNSCRSQIAEALGRHLAGNVFASFSAGTETKPQINQDAVRLMKEYYNIDMEAEGQHSKLLSDIPEVDVVITMGCNVQCPNLPCKMREDWGLDDPTGKADEEYIKVMKKIEEKVKELAEKIETL